MVSLGLAICVSSCFCLGGWTNAAAASQAGKPPVSDANSVVAAYLVNFLRYVDWPENVSPAGEPWRIGVLNAEDLRPALERMISGNTVRGRPITAVHSSDATELRDCHMVMLGGSLRTDYEDAAKTFAGRPLLTVVYHEKETATDQVMIQLVLRGRTIRYRLNAALLTAQGLRPTPGLLENALPPAAPVARSP